jgi:hypothetical protein
LKEEALDRIKWRNRFGRGCGPVVCLTDYWWILNECLFCRLHPRVEEVRLSEVKWSDNYFVASLTGSTRHCVSCLRHALTSSQHTQQSELQSCQSVLCQSQNKQRSVLNWLVFTTVTQCVYCAVRSGSLYGTQFKLMLSLASRLRFYRDFPRL